MAKYYLATITFILFSVLLMPLSASAAYNTVTFTEDTNIVLGSTTLTISSGGNVEAMRIYTTYVEFDMLDGSSVTISSADRYALANPLGVEEDCTATYSRISLSSATTQTMTVTPGSSDTCTVAAASPSGGGSAPAADTTAPSISGIASVPADTTSVISWTTGESSISWVVYGTSTSYGSENKTTSRSEETR